MATNSELEEEDLRATFIQHLHLALVESLEDQQHLTVPPPTIPDDAVLEQLNQIWEKFKRDPKEGWLTAHFEVDESVEEVLALAGFPDTTIGQQPIDWGWTGSSKASSEDSQNDSHIQDPNNLKEVLFYVGFLIVKTHLNVQIIGVLEKTRGDWDNLIKQKVERRTQLATNNVIAWMEIGPWCSFETMSARIMMLMHLLFKSFPNQADEENNNSDQRESKDKEEDEDLQK